jgi:hypothetical protein
MNSIRPSCLITDEIAFLLLIAVVYFEVRYMMNQYQVKFQQELNDRDCKLNMMNLENQNALEKSTSNFTSATERIERIEPLEGRFETLEDMLKGLITAETSVLKSSTTRLRALIDSGTLWPKKQQKVEAELAEAAKREAAWQKAAEWA